MPIGLPSVTMSGTTSWFSNPQNDVPVRVVFLRDGERKETIVTPTARK